MSRSLALAMVVLALPGILSAAEIPGKVLEVQDGTVKVKIKSTQVPATGDKVEIFFEIDGLDEKALVATGKVGSVAGDIVVVKIERSPGKVEKDQLATVYSELAKKKGGIDVLDLIAQVRENANQTVSSNNLRQLAIALLNKEAVDGRFPPAAIYSKDGKPLLSWRVAVLPYLEKQDLYKRFKLDEPWDSDHNMKLLAEMPKVYAVPEQKTKEPYSTYYQVFAGKGTAFDGMQGLKPAEIRDGLSNTLMVIEAGVAVPWTKPEDLVYAADNPLPKLGGPFRNVIQAAFFDGAALPLRRDLDEKVLRALITPSGGETLPARETWTK